MPSPRAKPSLTSLVAFAMFIALPVLYVLSYAPVVRVCGTSFILPEGDRFHMADDSLYPPYKAIDWLIDSTPLRKPLFAWAEVWGVGVEFKRGFTYRYRSRVNEQHRRWNSAPVESPSTAPPINTG